MGRFTTDVVDVNVGFVSHPNPDQQFKLARIQRELGKTHILAWCGGCDWFLRYPRREIDILLQATHTHMLAVHFDALLDGRACLDTELVDGGQQYLQDRWDQHLSDRFSAVSPIRKRRQ